MHRTPSTSGRRRGDRKRAARKVRVRHSARLVPYSDEFGIAAQDDVLDAIAARAALPAPAKPSAHAAKPRPVSQATPLLVPQPPPLAVPVQPLISGKHAIRVKKSMCVPVVDYDKPGDVGEHDPFAEADFRLAQAVYRALQRWYPDQRWQVKVDHHGGIVAITLPILMKRNLYQIVHIASLTADPGMKCIMRAAGECLERVGLPRAGFALDRFLEARQRGPYGRRPPQKLILPEFPSSARPRDSAPAVA